MTRNRQFWVLRSGLVTYGKKNNPLHATESLRFDGLDGRICSLSGSLHFSSSRLSVSAQLPVCSCNSSTAVNVRCCLGVASNDAKARSAQKLVLQNVVEKIAPGRRGRMMCLDDAKPSLAAVLVHVNVEGL